MAKNKIDDIERIQTMINSIDFCYEHSKKEELLKLIVKLKQ